MKKMNRRTVIKEYPVAGNKLTLKVHGSKNCALAVVMYTFLLGKGNKITIKNVPPITDIVNTLKMFRVMGGIFKYKKGRNELVVFEGIKSKIIPSYLLCRTRISVLIMSIMLVKYGYVSFPKKIGGCNLGNRPYNYHLDAFRELGCVIEENDDYYLIKRKKSVKNKILKFINETTTGTENALFFANYNSRNTIIKKAHRRPEILELIKFMNILGANIKIEKKNILIKKTQKEINNKKVVFTIIDDMEEALSYIALSFATDSNLKLLFNNPYKYKEIETLISLSKGCFKKVDHFLIQTPYIFPKHKFINITTGAYPGFSSDAQPIMASILLKISESFKITDTRFLGRFMYSEYFKEFGIQYRKTDKSINVISTRHGDDLSLKRRCFILTAYDLRSAMNAILTASVIKRKVEILNMDLILRGYANFFKVLKAFKFKLIRQ